MRHFSCAAGILGAALLICCLSPMAFAQSGTIQMLPPQEAGQPCPPGTARVLTWDGQNAIGCASNVTIDSNGDLNTGGSVKIGNNTAACTPAMAGAIRYNPSDTAFEGCNGSSWNNLASAGTSCPNSSVPGYDGGGSTPNSYIVVAGAGPCSGGTSYQCQNGSWVEVGATPGPSCAP